MKKIISIISLMFILTACSSGSNESDGISGFFGKEPVKDVTIQAETLDGKKLGEAVKTGADGSFSLSIPDTGKDIIIKVIDNSVKVENFVGASALPGESTFDSRNVNLMNTMNGWMIFVPANTKALFTPLSVAASKAATGATNAEKILDYKAKMSSMAGNLSSLTLNLAPKYALTKDEILNGEYTPNLEFVLQIADIISGGRTAYDDNYYSSLVNIPASSSGLKELYPTIDPTEIVANAKLLAENVAKETKQTLKENDADRISQLENTIVLSTIINPLGVSAYDVSIIDDSFMKISYRDIVVPSGKDVVYKYSASAFGATAKNYSKLELNQVLDAKLCSGKREDRNQAENEECDRLDAEFETLLVPPTAIERIVITEVNKGLSYDLPITKDEFLEFSGGRDWADDRAQLERQFKNTTTTPFFRLNLETSEEPVSYLIEVLADYSGQKIASSMTVRVSTDHTEITDTGCGGFEGIVNLALCD